MNYQTFVAMLNPAMSAIFGASLLALWYHHRHLSYILVLVFSYAIRFLCFGILYVAFAQDERGRLGLWVSKARFARVPDGEDRHHIAIDTVSDDITVLAKLDHPFPIRLGQVFRWSAQSRL